MTGILTPPRRYGKHWEDLGFQTNDPISDLRSTGMMGLLLPLGLFAKYKTFGSRLVGISRGECPFPLMIVLINYVKETLDLLPTTDILMSATNKEEAWNNILLYFAGLCYNLAYEWEKDNLDFEHNYNIFEQIYIRGRSNIESVLNSGLKAEKEDSSQNLPLLKEDKQ